MGKINNLAERNSWQVSSFSCYSATVQAYVPEGRVPLLQRQMHQPRPSLQLLQRLWGLRLGWNQLQQERCVALCCSTALPHLTASSSFSLLSLWSCDPVRADNVQSDCRSNRTVCIDGDEAHCVINGTDSFCSCKPGFQSNGPNRCDGMVAAHLPATFTSQCEKLLRKLSNIWKHVHYLRHSPAALLKYCNARWQLTRN